jgi:hypothetical protein
VKPCIKDFLGRLPAAFGAAILAQKMEFAFQHVYDSH